MSHRKVRSVKSADVVTVREGTPFKDVVRALSGCDVSAVPVVDGDRHVVGVVSEADLLVKQGTPFRESHGVIAGLVREAVEGGKSLADVAIPKLGEDARAVLAQSSWLESKASEGGTALARVREQLDAARALLA